MHDILDARLAALTADQKHLLQRIVLWFLDAIDAVEKINLGTESPDGWSKLGDEWRIRLATMQGLFPAPHYLAAILADGPDGSRAGTIHLAPASLWPAYLRKRNAQARRLLRELAAALEDATANDYVIRRNGDVWEIIYEQERGQLTDRNAITWLALILANPRKSLVP